MGIEEVQFLSILILINQLSLNSNNNSKLISAPPTKLFPLFRPSRPSSTQSSASNVADDDEIEILDDDVEIIDFTPAKVSLPSLMRKLGKQTFIRFQSGFKSKALFSSLVFLGLVW